MKIGELATRSQIPVETIRYYEREGLLPAAPRTGGNYRIYGGEQVERLAFIRHCRSLDMALGEIRVLLHFKDAPQGDCGDVNALIDAHIAQVASRIRELRQLESQLKRLRARCGEPRAAAECGDPERPVGPGGRVTAVRTVAGVVLALAVVGLLLLLARTAWRIQEAAQLARESEPLQHRPAQAALRLLILGDSTAVGTGASAPAQSLAGLLAARFPQLWIDNRARDGATWADLPSQLAGDERFDLVLIQAGGNDVIRLRDMAAVQADIATVTARALQRAEVVVLMPAGNVGNAELLFAPLSWWMSARARALHAAIAEAARDPRVRYVNLYHDAAEDPFVQRPGLHARDGLHPSDAGYRVWLDELLTQTGLAAPGGLLQAAQGSGS